MRHKNFQERIREGSARSSALQDEHTPRTLAFGLTLDLVIAKSCSQDPPWNLNPKHYHLLTITCFPASPYLENSNSNPTGTFDLDHTNSSLSLTFSPLLSQLYCISTNLNMPCIAYTWLHCSHLENTTSWWNQTFHLLQVFTHSWSRSTTTTMASLYIHDQTLTVSR